MEHWKENLHFGDDNIAFAMMEHNTVCPGREMVPHGLIVAVTEHGILLNGDSGTNPSREEMAETLEIMRRAVEAWDRRYGKNKVVVEYSTGDET